MCLCGCICNGNHQKTVLGVRLYLVRHSKVTSNNNFFPSLFLPFDSSPVLTTPSNQSKPHRGQEHNNQNDSISEISQFSLQTPLIFFSFSVPSGSLKMRSKVKSGHVCVWAIHQCFSFSLLQRGLESPAQKSRARA